jgi:hypothetical protein
VPSRSVAEIEEVRGLLGSVTHGYCATLGQAAAVHNLSGGVPQSGIPSIAEGIVDEDGLSSIRIEYDGDVWLVTAVSEVPGDKYIARKQQYLSNQDRAEKHAYITYYRLESPAPDTLESWQPFLTRYAGTVAFAVEQEGEQA